MGVSRDGTSGPGGVRSKWPALLRQHRNARFWDWAAGPILIATGVLFLVSWLVEPASVRGSALLGMLPFAGLLAIAAMGQTLVIQQGGIDLSVAGMLSMTVVIMTLYPNGDTARVPVAILLAFAVTL